jgi:uncharacterized OsmC-like protein
MTIEQPLKIWSITAKLDCAGLTFVQGGAQVAAPSITGAILSPVEYLLFAIAGCLALSVKAAALARQQPFSSVEIVATGAKASRPPSRLGGLDLQVSLGTPLPYSEANLVLREAKQLCTVTNTIAAPPLLNTAWAASQVREVSTEDAHA